MQIKNFRRLTKENGAQEVLVKNGVVEEYVNKETARDGSLYDEEEDLSAAELLPEVSNDDHDMLRKVVAAAAVKERRKKSREKTQKIGKEQRTQRAQRSGNPRRGRNLSEEERMAIMKRRFIYWIAIPLGSILAVLILALGVGIFSLKKLGMIGDVKLYQVKLNGESMGQVADTKEARETYLRIRREIVSEDEGLVIMPVDFETEEVTSIIKIAVKPEQYEENVRHALAESYTGVIGKAYTMKIDDYIVTLENKHQVAELLERVLAPYDKQDEFGVQIVADNGTQMNLLTTRIVRTEEKDDIAAIATEENSQTEAGISEFDESEESEEEPEEETDGGLPDATGANDGLKDIAFVEKIEIAESFVTNAYLTSVDDAYAEITSETEEDSTYEVVAGDCISIVAQKNGMTIANLLEMNPGMDENTVLQIGDRLVITVPEPELSVATWEELTYEEDYTRPVQYIDNTGWYTTRSEVKQEAVTGHRTVTALVASLNGTERGKTVLAETIQVEAQPKIVERGTLAPPTYIKPISGGRFTSGFKMRWGRMHKGVDWACPIGTAVRASSGGVVVSSGWMNGYGYCVTIKHPDGKQTRYGHNSKLLVRVGQSVKQGDKIALSGNTGRSTGPHVHFEIIVNGSQVNPLNYL